MLALIPRALIGLVALFAGLALFSPPDASDSAVWGGGGGGGQRYIPWDCAGWTPIAAADRETGILETLAQNRGKTLYCGIDQSDTFSKAETWEVGEPRNERDDTVYWGDHGSFRGFTAPQEGWLTDGESGVTGISMNRVFEFPREERRRKKKPTPPPPPIPEILRVEAQAPAVAEEIAAHPEYLELHETGFDYEPLGSYLADLEAIATTDRAAAQRQLDAVLLAAIQEQGRIQCRYFHGADSAPSYLTRNDGITLLPAAGEDGLYRVNIVEQGVSHEIHWTGTCVRWR